MKKIIISFSIFLILSNCDLYDRHLTDQFINLTIKSVETVQLESDSKIKFKLWGYDANWADQSATLLNSYIFDITQIPSSFILEYKSEWENNIEPNTGSESNFGFYITLSIDADNNGTIDENDYTKDYDNSPETYHGSQIANLSGDIYIKANPLSIEQEF